MDKHVTLVGILNIVYRSVVILGAGLLFALAVGFGPLFDALVRTGSIRPDEVPVELLDIIPVILSVIAGLMVIVSVVGIIGAVGVLKKREWGRIVLLVVSFFSLARIPLGTVLGIYSIWVLLNQKTIRLFDTSATTAATKELA